MIINDLCIAAEIFMDSVQIPAPLRRSLAIMPRPAVQIFITSLRQPIGPTRVLVRVDHWWPTRSARVYAHGGLC